MAERNGLKPVAFAPLDHVWLPGYPAPIRWGAKLEFKVHRALGYLGRRVGYAFEKSIRWE